MSTVLFIDTETGGLDPQKHSLLSVGFVIWKDKQIIDGIEFFYKNNEYVVTPRAMEINRISIPMMTAVAKDKDQIATELGEFLKAHGYGVSDMPFTMGGHNTSFDMGFLKANFPDIGDLLSHRMIDTAAILKFMYHAGKLPEDLSNSTKALDYFKIGDPSKRHGALNDAYDTANLYNALLQL